MDRRGARSAINRRHDPIGVTLPRDFPRRQSVVEHLHLCGIKLDGLAGRLPERARRILGELDLDVGSMTTMTLQGTLQQVVVNVNGVPLDRNKLRDTGLRRDDRERLKLLGQQLRDKFIR